MSDVEKSRLTTEIKTPVSKEHAEEGYVVLPVGERQFGDFIKSLLGSPQTISNTIEGAFEIDANSVKSLHSLLIQRISQQNGGEQIDVTPGG